MEWEDVDHRNVKIHLIGKQSKHTGQQGICQRGQGVVFATYTDK